MNIFYLYNTQTGEYIGRRETSIKYPTFESKIIGINIDRIPSNIKDKVIEHPEYFKYIDNNLVEISQEEKDTIIEEMKVLTN